MIYQQNYSDDKRHLLTKNICGYNISIGLIMVVLPKNRPSMYLAIARPEVCQEVRPGPKCREGNMLPEYVKPAMVWLTAFLAVF